MARPRDTHRVWHTPPRMRLLAVAAVVAVLVPVSALACRCEPKTLADAARTADVVLVGVIGAEVPVGPRGQVATVKLEEVLKGTVSGPDVTVKSDDPKRSCPRPTLAPGRWVLFLARDGKDGLNIRSCDQHSTSSNTDARVAEVKRILGAGPGQPKLDEAKARSLAMAAADAALAAAYAKTPWAAQEKHDRAWVHADAVQAVGNAAQGWTFTWMQAPPAGFEFVAIVHVAPDGRVTVKKAHASFSPD